MINKWNIFYLLISAFLFFSFFFLQMSPFNISVISTTHVHMVYLLTNTIYYVFAYLFSKYVCGGVILHFPV